MFWQNMAITVASLVMIQLACRIALRKLLVSPLDAKASPLVYKYTYGLWVATRVLLAIEVLLAGGKLYRQYLWAAILIGGVFCAYIALTTKPYGRWRVQHSVVDRRLLDREAVLFDLVNDWTAAHPGKSIEVRRGGTEELQLWYGSSVVVLRMGVAISADRELYRLHSYLHTALGSPRPSQVTVRSVQVPRMTAPGMKWRAESILAMDPPVISPSP